MDMTNAPIVDKAERVGKHMSYQLGVVDRNYKRDKNATFLACALDGSDFSKTYYDPRKGRNVVERVRLADMVLPYKAGPCYVHDLERKTHVISKSINDTRIFAKHGYFISPCKSDVMADETPTQQVENYAQGLVDSDPYRMDKPAKLLEQHRLLDLDGDGIAEPYIVWVDATDKTVKRLQIRWEVDNMGEAISEKQALEYFTQFNFFPNPNGVYGLGYGHVGGILNKAINTMLRESSDAGQLANIGNMSGFISEALGIKGGAVEFELGKFIKIPRGVEDIRKHIMMMQFPGPNAAYGQIMELLMNVAQRLLSTTDAVTGDVQKVLQPLTIMTMLESSLQMPTSVMEQMAISFEDEFEKLYRLNQKYLTHAEYFVDGKEQVIVTPEDYDSKLHITPILDPKMITRQQKMAKGQALFDFAIKDPVLASNPQSMKEVTRRVLLSMDTEDIEALLPPEPEILHIDNQEEENMYYLMPPEMRPLFDVAPDQDHLGHIASIDAFINWLTLTDPIGGAAMRASVDPSIDKAIQMMDEQSKQEIVQQLIMHRRKHIAFLYGQKEGVLNGQGQNTGMGAPGGDAMGIPGTGEEISPLGGFEGLPIGSGGIPQGPAFDSGGVLPPDTGGLGLLGMEDITPSR